MRCPLCLSTIPVPAEKVIEIVVRYLDKGDGSTAIAHDLGCSETYVLDVLHRAGVKIRAKGVVPNHRAPLVRERAQVLEMVRLRKEEMMTYPEIAKLTGVARGTVRRWVLDELKAQRTEKRQTKIKLNGA